MLQMEKIDVISWLNTYLVNKKINAKSVEHVMYFSLLWNLFEHTYYTKTNKLDPNALIDLAEVSINNLDSDEVEKYYNHFKKRYIGADSLSNSKFNKLLLCKTSKSNTLSNYEFCKSIIENEFAEKEDKLKCLFLIIHRFRNNLFHGNKETLRLNLYEREFKVINKFLMHFIEQTGKNEIINNKRFSK